MSVPTPAPTDDSAAHWKADLAPLRGRAWPLRCAKVFSPAEVDLLQRGLWPRDMDDRWIIRLDGDVLRCWRSWTRTCLYEAVVSRTPDGGATCSVLHVLDDPEHYHRSPQDDSELDRFDGVLALLLGETRAA